MGEVKGDNYVKTGNRPACDGRCTHACGPICDCSCGGANHGTGRTVQTITILGKVKAVGLSEEDVERAHAFRKLRDVAEEAYTAKYAQEVNDVKSQCFVSRDRYIPMMRDRRELDKILTMKIYNTRHTSLLTFIVKSKV